MTVDILSYYTTAALAVVEWAVPMAVDILSYCRTAALVGVE